MGNEKYEMCIKQIREEAIVAPDESRMMRIVADSIKERESCLAGKFFNGIGRASAVAAVLVAGLMVGQICWASYEDSFYREERIVAAENGRGRMNGADMMTLLSDLKKYAGKTPIHKNKRMEVLCSLTVSDLMKDYSILEDLR